MPSTEQIKEKFWQGHISGWRKSSVGIREYCRRHGISKDTFYYWRKRIGTSTDNGQPGRTLQSARPIFAPVTIDRSEALSSRPSSDYFQDPKWLGEFAAALIRGLR